MQVDFFIIFKVYKNHENSWSPKAKSIVGRKLAIFPLVYTRSGSLIIKDPIH